MTLRITILGCGSSTGVPRVGNDWGACNPNNPKNRRRRSSCLSRGLVRTGGLSWLSTHRRIFASNFCRRA